MRFITKTQTYPWEPLGGLQSTWESPQPASNLCSLQEALGVDGSKIKSLVGTIFGIRRKIETHYILTILCFPDGCVKLSSPLDFLSSVVLDWSYGGSFGHWDLFVLGELPEKKGNC